MTRRRLPKLPPGVVCGHFDVHWTRITSQSGTIDVAHCRTCGQELGVEYPRVTDPYRTGRP